MPAEKNKHLDYQPIKSITKNGNSDGSGSSLFKSSQKSKIPAKDSSLKNVRNSVSRNKEITIPSEDAAESRSVSAETLVYTQEKNIVKPEPNTFELTAKESPGSRKIQKKAEKDFELLNRENWLLRNGHTLSYIGLYVFTVMVLFRPYELIPSLSFLSTSAFYLAAATVLVYLPTQLAAEGSLTALSTEVKCVLALMVIALVTMPIAKDPSIAWATFSDNFIKAILMFIVMINVVRTRRRLVNLLWISLAIAVYLSFTAVSSYMKGELNVEGYRVGVEVGGLFGNPNDLALHLVTMIPISLTLALASRSKAMRFVYFLITIIFIAGNMVSFSRGGFIGLLASSAVLVWKLGRNKRFKVSLISSVAGLFFILLAPGNYGLRLLSIFIPALDPVGSSDQRKELLIRSVLVTLRNPWGIGIGNFPIVGVRNLVTHNSFTQVSSELGILGLIVYLIFLISPFRKLGAIERTLYAKEDYDWFYYVSIGLQASIVAYMCSGFFVAVAYNWFAYYLIAYAVAFRRVYKVAEESSAGKKDTFKLQTV